MYRATFFGILRCPLETGLTVLPALNAERNIDRFQGHVISSRSMCSGVVLYQHYKAL